MKISIIILSVILCACDNAVRFEVPQPQGQKDLKSIPKKLIGTYLNIEDSAVLIIDKEQIVKTVRAAFAGLLQELDSAERALIKGDTIFSETDGIMKLDVTVRGDSIFQHMDYSDTLFSMAAGDILRKFKGYYFLNSETSADRWHVMKLGLTKGGLTLGKISTKTELESLRQLTETTADSSYNFSPTRKQLKKFIKNKGFKAEETYVKID